MSRITVGALAAVTIALVMVSPEAAAQRIDPCDGVSCNEHGRCVVVRGEPVCACEEGYAPDPTRINCQPTERPEARPPAMPSGPRTGRQVHVVSYPPASRLTLDGDIYMNYGVPHTFSLSTGMHNITLRRGGYERADVAIPAGDRDLLIEVDMSRPVFEAGIALTVIGGLLYTIALIAWNTDTGGFGSLAEPFAIGIVYGGMLISGVLMMALDRHRDPTYRISEQ